MQLGIIGLGKMGGNLALQAVEKKIDVIGKARRKKPELEKKGSRWRQTTMSLLRT